MMINNWKTDLTVNPSKQAIDNNDAVLTVGSCFADVVGNYLTRSKFKTMVNPFGTIYNPISIHALLEMAIRKEEPSPEAYLERDGLCYHYQFHSDFCEPDRAALQARIKNQLANVLSFLTTCKVIVLTYGTAFVYVRKDTGTVVANCHKMPAETFEKKMLAMPEIVASYQSLIDSLRKINPTVQVITTVSPVRHLKDTLPLNSVSKSILRVACHNLGELDTDYFPAYEIMMDDLRDYRFYKTDRIHPTEEAEEYILEKFKVRYFSSSTASLLNELEKVRQALAHRPMQPGTLAHQTFLRKILSQLNAISHQVNVADEIKLVKSQLPS
jgi:hypothetical protein